MSASNGASFQSPSDFGSEIASRNFHIMSVMARMAGATLVQVVAVSSGAVDVQPLVNQTSQSVASDGTITTIGTKHGVLHGLPYFQPQSGKSAVEITPTVGDIGLAIFADRDISNVIATKQQSNPGSRRIFDMSDGLYLGAFPGLNQPITQFVKFDPASGITITSPIAVTVNAPTATVNAATSATIKSPSISLGNGGTLHGMLNSLFATYIAGHVHSNGNGGANTGAPTTSPAANTQTTVVQAE